MYSFPIIIKLKFLSPTNIESSKQVSIVPVSVFIITTFLVAMESTICSTLCMFSSSFVNWIKGHVDHREPSPVFTLLFAVAVVPEGIKNRGDFLRDSDIRIAFPLVMVSVKECGDKADDHKARKEQKNYSDQTHTVHLLHGTKEISLSRFPFYLFLFYLRCYFLSM